MIAAIIRKVLKKRKVKLFLVFLLCATVAWFINKLSDTYRSTVVFDIDYVNAPANLLLMDASHDKINIKLEGLGFQFFGLGLRNKKLQIDLATIEKRDGKFFIPQKMYRKQIEKQLFSTMKLLEIEEDALYFDFQQLVSKKVPIKPNVQFDFAQNYMLDGSIAVKPDSITINGPQSEIDTISSITATKIVLNNLSDDFSEKASIIKWEALENTSFSSTAVLVSGAVSKFSEKQLTVKIVPVNLPDSVSVKMFPEEVGILCKGTLEALKEISPTDFTVLADYENLKSTTKKIPLKLHKTPQQLYSAILQESEVEYILERQ